MKKAIEARRNENTFRIRTDSEKRPGGKLITSVPRIGQSLARPKAMTRAEANLYSRQWFELFHVGIEEARTFQETEFVCRCAPFPEFRNILDVCCGMGRQARALWNRGYSVVGIDRDADVIAKARELGCGPNFVAADICDYQPETGAFDAVIVMGQSFGHFDATTNRDVLGRLASGIRKRGRIILDLWNPEFFAAHQGERDLNTSRGIVRERKHIDDGRLIVQLNYPDGSHEQFEWQLFKPAQMKRLANSIGLALLSSCSGFDLATVPSPTSPRIQFLLEHTCERPRFSLLSLALVGKRLPRNKSGKTV